MANNGPKGKEQKRCLVLAICFEPFFGQQQSKESYATVESFAEVELAAADQKDQKDPLKPGTQSNIMSKAIGMARYSAGKNRVRAWTSQQSLVWSRMECSTWFPTKGDLFCSP